MSCESTRRGRRRWATWSGTPSAVPPGARVDPMPEQAGDQHRHHQVDCHVPVTHPRWLVVARGGKDHAQPAEAHYTIGDGGDDVGHEEGGAGQGWSQRCMAVTIVACSPLGRRGRRVITCRDRDDGSAGRGDHSVAQEKYQSVSPVMVRAIRASWWSRPAGCPVGPVCHRTVSQRGRPPAGTDRRRRGGIVSSAVSPRRSPVPTEAGDLASTGSAIVGGDARQRGQWR